MSTNREEKTIGDKAKQQAAAFGIGGIIGAATRHSMVPRHMSGHPCNPNLAAQAGSAFGASLAAGNGVNAAVAASAALVATKVAAGAAIATAAAPAVATAAIVGTGLYALKKLFS